MKLKEAGMAKHRIRKYSRRTRSVTGKSRAGLIVFLIIAFLLLSAVISVAVGIALGKRADAVRPEEKYDLSIPDYTSDGKTVTSVEAYHFPVGANPGDYAYQGIYDLSVLVRHKDGRLAYAFDTGERFPIDEMGDVSFSSLCSSAKDAGVRVCAYLYVTSFSCTDVYEREILKAYEISLIAEVAESGADDILLLGIDVNEDNISEIEEFVSRAASAAVSTPLGVAVDRETVSKTENDIYLAARVRALCDYLALDLTDLTVADGESIGKDENGDPIRSRLSEILDSYAYYVRTYPMRVIFSQSEFKIYEPALALGVENMQIVAE